MNSVNNTKYFFFLSYLALLSMLGFIATDMYLPAFKAIEDTMQSSPAQVASTLTSFLAGLAIGQLMYGPLVQRIGKRNSLLVGLIIFAAASFSIASSETVFAFNVSRFFQAIGACSAGVIWQAIVIEKYDAAKAQRVFSNIMPLVALSPALAPLLGALVLESTGWQSIFLILTGLAVFLMLMTLIFVPKEVMQKHEASKTRAISNWGLLNNTKYLGNVIIFGACSGAFFAYLTLWPIVMEQHGFAAKEIGLSFIPQTIMFIFGGYANKILIRKLGTEKTLSVLLVAFAVSVLAIVASTLIFSVDTLLPLLISFSVLAAANGAIYPIVVNNALQEFTNNAAKAAGLQNFLQISIAFGASSLVAIWAAQGEVTIGWGILICALGVFAGYALSKQSSWTQVRANFTRTAVDSDKQIKTDRNR
ncbi:purine nucleoside transporter PunC [Shewanella violacea]|uniref:Bcr/CflA family efflux transporter n=1 Tax=Shewanella violacea (strain JCM 10179 / CIP 106290 / LMG 19151 / DSS12) TaxID=637905 RepID=D4ZKQ6_SHEVD|nr:purine nucleoside transporter PunC [Shewanella violacea]BAJ02255.1 drug resistance transporter, Bcr/CflA family protein [Shewanella violacea DSS12]